MKLKNYSKILLVLMLIVAFSSGFTQKSIGEYKYQLIQDQEDSVKFDYYTKIIKYYYGVNLDSAKYFAEEKLDFAQNVSNEFHEAEAYNDLGLAYDFSNEFDDANRLYNQSLQKFKEIGNQPGIANALLNLGIVQYFTGNYEKSLEYYLSSLKITEEIGDKKKLSSLFNNIGTIYRNLSKYPEAITYYQKGEKIDAEMGDTAGLAGTLNNLGIAYKMDGRIEEALECYEKSVELKLSIGDERGTAATISNLSRLYFAKGENKKALELGLKALNLEMKFDLPLDMFGSYINLGEIYLSQNNLKKAEEFLLKGLALKDVVVQYSYNQELFGFLSLLEKKKGNYKKSLEFAELYDAYKDSVYEEQSLQTVLELKSKYESEKQEQEIESLKKENELKELAVEREKITADKEKAERIAEQEASKRKSFLLWGIVILFILVLAVAMYTIKVNKDRKRDNILLSEQKNQIEEKNKEITDSINYAQRIQHALLKAEDHVSENFPPHFILFKPKDIVSGDFYWAIEKQDYIYIAAADCTGHGVPGAFMSMLGISFLNEINSGEDILTPAEILDILREKIIRELGQKGDLNGSKDGMDISILRLGKNKTKVDWAGANNPLYIVNEKGVEEVKPNRQPVAFSDKMIPFSNHSVTVDKGSMLYIFSDGFVDQFGGDRGKKFKSKQYKELLNQIFHKPMEKQKSELNVTFENWRGDIEQIDDVCIIGVRI